MDKNKAEVKLSFDPTKSDLVSVKLRVSFQRDRRRYSFPIKEGLLLSKNDFDKLLEYHQTKNKRIAERIREHYAVLEPHLKKAEALTEKLRPFSFDAFRDEFYRTDDYQEQTEADDLIGALISKAAQMKSQGRISNGVNYELTGKSLKRFVASLTNEERKKLKLPYASKKSKKSDEGMEILYFRQVTKEFLDQYEQWMTSHEEKSLTTVGIYCRHLRAVFNDAIEAGIITRNEYPFGKNRYIIPAGKNVKKALSKEDIKKLMAYECIPGTMEQRGRDLWVFSYLSNGMNMADICQLRWNDIDLRENKLTFIRQKTSRSRKGNQTKITVHLNAETLAILTRWGTSPRFPKTYVFPFLTDDMSPERQRRTIQQVIKMTNKYIRRIAKTVGVTGDVTTYAARHSFATILLQSEAPLAFISQSLGHTNIKTTEYYLGSFDDDKTKKYLEALL